MKWWPWRRRRPSRGLDQARERLAAVKRDDRRVDRIAESADRHLRENRLGPIVARALQVRHR